MGFGVAGLFVVSYFFTPLFTFSLAILILLMVAVFIDCVILYDKKTGVFATRILSDRFSNGEENKVVIQLVNNYYSLPFNADVIDEMPFQFQERNW